VINSIAKGLFDLVETVLLDLSLNQRHRCLTQADIAAVIADKLVLHNVSTVTAGRCIYYLNSVKITLLKAVLNLAGELLIQQLEMTVLIYPTVPLRHQK
jgi:hypothetical protein